MSDGSKSYFHVFDLSLFIQVPVKRLELSLSPLKRRVRGQLRYTGAMRLERIELIDIPVKSRLPYHLATDACDRYLIAFASVFVSSFFLLSFKREGHRCLVCSPL